MRKIPESLLKYLASLGANVVYVGSAGLPKTTEEIAMDAKIEGKDAQRAAEVDHLTDAIQYYEDLLKKSQKDSDTMKLDLENMRYDLAESKQLLDEFEGVIVERNSYHCELMAIHQVIGKPVTNKITKAELLVMIKHANEILNGAVSK